MNIFPHFYINSPSFSPLQNPRNSGLPPTILSPPLSTATVMPPVPPKNETTYDTMWEYSRKPMRLLTQPLETTCVIHRLYGKNRHSKLITKNTLPHVWANTPACMCQRFSMCKPIHTYVFAVRCIIFRRILLYLSEKPTKGFPKFFWCKEQHDGCTTAATAFALVHKVLTPGCRSARS